MTGRACVLLVWVLAAPLAWAAPAGGSDTWLVPAFEPVGVAPEQQWMGELLAELVVDAFEASGVPVYATAEREQLWEAYSLPRSAPLAHATLVAIGRIARASQVLVGSYALSDGTLRVTARVLHVTQPALGPAVEEAGDLADVLTVASRVSGRVVHRPPALAGPLAEVPLAAIEQFVKGRLAGSPAQRLDHLGQALRMAPALARARLAQWALHRELDADADALAAVRAVPPDSAWSRLARMRAAVSLAEMGRWAESRRELEALAQEQADAAVLNNLAIVRSRLGDGPATLFAEAIALDPMHPDIRFNAGYRAWRRGESAEAVGPLREAVRLNEADAQAHVVLAAALGALGRASEAAAERGLAARLDADLAGMDPSGAVGWERLLLDPVQPGSPRADRALTAARAQSQRTAAAAYVTSGRQALDAGRAADAVSDLRRAVYLRPYDGDLHRLLSAACLAAGLTREALDAARLAVFAADDVASRLALAEALAQAGDRDAARAEWRIVLEREPGHAVARRRLGEK